MDRGGFTQLRGDFALLQPLANVSTPLAHASRHGRRLLRHERQRQERRCGLIYFLHGQKLPSLEMQRAGLLSLALDLGEREISIGMSPGEFELEMNLEE